MITYHGTSNDIKVLNEPSTDRIFYVASKPEYAAYHSFGRYKGYADSQPSYAGYVYLVEIDDTSERIADFRTALSNNVIEAVSEPEKYDWFYVPYKIVKKCIDNNDFHLIGIASKMLQFLVWMARYRKDDVILPVKEELDYYGFESIEYDELVELTDKFIHEYGMKSINPNDMKSIEMMKSCICEKMYRYGYRAYRDYEQVGLKYSNQRKINVKSDIFGVFGWGVIQSISKNPLPKEFVIDNLTDKQLKTRKDAAQFIRTFKETQADMEKLPYYKHSLKLKETAT